MAQSSNRHSRTHLEVHVVPGHENPFEPLPGPGPGPEPMPEAAPPQPATNVVLLVLKETYRIWIAAGGTPPIYGNVAPPALISPPQ